MTILDLIKTPGLMKKASSAKGGEYHGPCPLCGGSKRFHVWPNQGDRGGTCWCRDCDLAGDAIVFLKRVEGMSCPDAHAYLGLECESTTCPVADKCRKGHGLAPAAMNGGTIPERSTTSGTFSAPDRPLPVDIWQQKAAVFLTTCHQALLDSLAGLEWLLKNRGITRETVVICQLGLNSGENDRDIYRSRVSWGLPEELKEDNKPRKLWIPRGLVIPRVTNGIVDRLRIRRPDAALQSDPSEKPKRYIVVPGSCSSPLILPCRNGSTIAWIIVESELDAILLWQLVGDLVGIMAMGNSSARPDVIAHGLLTAARHISVALDYDARTNSETGKYENPGGKEVFKWWLPTYPQAERTPLVGGKDPCAAWLNGIDLRAWALAGLPPAFRIADTTSRNMTTGQKSVELHSKGEGAAAPVSSLNPHPSSVLVHVFTAKDGRQVHITDDPGEYKRLVTERKIVFDSKEIAFVKLTDADQDQTARFLDAKQVFPGSRIVSATQGELP